jgi:hypothetical protein
VGTALGLLGILVFIPSVIALAAAVTWTVVRLTPQPRRRAEADANEAKT